MAKKHSAPANPDDYTIPTSAWLWVMNCGLLLVVVGTALPLLLIDGSLFRYIFSAGAALALLGRICSPRYKGSILRVRRLNRLEFWSCIFFCVAAFFMWYNPAESRDWLAFTLAGGVIEIYASFMIPRAFAKHGAEQKK